MELWILILILVILTTLLSLSLLAAWLEHSEVMLPRG